MNIERLAQISPYWTDCLAYPNDIVMPSITLQDGPAARAVQAGIASLRSNDLNAGFAAFQQALQQARSPNEKALAIFLLGVCALHGRHPGEGAKFFRQLVDANPRMALTRYYLALCQLKTGEHASAWKNLQRCVKDGPDFKQGWAGLALIAGLAGDHQAALRASKKALNAGLEVGNGLLSLVKFQAEYRLGKLPAVTEQLNSDWFGPFCNEEHEQLLDQLPPIEKEYESDDFDDSRILVFCACDNNYFHQYAMPLAYSLAESGSQCNFQTWFQSGCSCLEIAL